MKNLSFNLQEALPIWRANLEKLAERINDGHTSISSYTRNEGPERDSKTYGHKIYFGSYCFYIECFYCSGGGKELRRLIVKSGFQTVVRFDINEIICLNQYSDAVKELSSECKRIHNLIDQMLAKKRADTLFGSALRRAEEVAIHF
jgi:hypothetical protein